MFDPRTTGGGGVHHKSQLPREGVTAWTGAPPLLPKVVPRSVPVRVSVVLVEETPGRSAGKLPSSQNSGTYRTIVGAASPAGVIDVVDSVMLPTIAGAVPPADVAKVVAADAACLADAGILFPADPVGTLSLTDQDGTLSPTDLAGILFSAVPAGIPFPTDPAGILFRPTQLNQSP